MDTYTADTYTVDLMNISSTGVTWDPNYGAVPPNNISTISISPTVWTTNNTGTSGQWLINDTSLTAPTSAKIALKGEDADIEINGESLCDMIRGIQDRLNILCPDPEMEQEWNELKELRKAYDTKLAECREKSRVWKSLQQKG